MDYGKLMKWLNMAVSKDETRPVLMKPAYLPKYDVTVATNGHRIHIIDGAHAPKADEKFPGDKIMEEVRKFRQTARAVFEWNVTGDDLRGVIGFLKWAAKAPKAYSHHAQRCTSLNINERGISLGSDLLTERAYHIFLPGTVKGQNIIGEIEVDPKYLAEALEMVEPKGNKMYRLRLSLPRRDEPTLKTALFVETLGEKPKRQAVILPIKSKLYEMRWNATRPQAQTA